MSTHDIPSEGGGTVYDKGGVKVTAFSCSTGNGEVTGLWVSYR